MVDKKRFGAWLDWLDELDSLVILMRHDFGEISQRISIVFSSDQIHQNIRKKGEK